MDGQQYARRKRNITESPWDGADLDGLVAADLYHLPVLRTPSSQYTLDPFRTTHSSHRRSISHPFPSILGSNGFKRSTGDEEDTIRSAGRTRAESDRSTNQRDADAGIHIKSPVKHGKEVMKDEDLRTGNCPTCDSMVRWPKKLDVYRCTNCLMINDLKPVGKHTTYGTTSNGVRQDGKTSRKVCPVTTERTRDIIQHCVVTYLRDKADEIRDASRTIPTKPPLVSVKSHNHELFNSEQEDIPVAPRYSNDQTSNPSSFPPTRSITLPIRQADQNGASRSTSDDRKRPAWKEVFAPLEDYLTSSLQDCDALNASFSLTRPTPLRTSSEVSNASEKYRRREELLSNEEGLFELDAKTLLLGDIGENGQWWTGERQTKAAKTRKEDEFERKPSRFDWPSIYAWYDAIISCGKDWKTTASMASSELMDLMATYESEIDIVFSQGRYHVQRTLLKGIETLLRRPGRPLQTLDDIRFLVILLANPLLYPRPSGPTTAKVVSIPQVDGSGKRKTSNDGPVKSQGIANGHHSGIIKRILGIIANLPLACHQTLISWFCRVSEAQFRDLVELVGGFVSYRLTRQMANPKSQVIDVTAGLIPDLTSPGGGTSAHLHAAIGETAKAQKDRKVEKEQAYRDDWQIKTAAKVMSLLFSANMFPRASRYEPRTRNAQISPMIMRQRTNKQSQLLPTNFFYNTRLDFVDLVGDFEAWEAKRGKFSFCQYPMFLSIWAKIHILEHDARRQMEIKARDAFFTTIMKGKAVSQYLVFKVRRECLADDSLKNISQIIGGGEEEIKKSLKIEFIGEEGVDAGG